MTQLNPATAPVEQLAEAMRRECNTAIWKRDHRLPSGMSIVGLNDTDKAAQLAAALLAVLDECESIKVRYDDEELRATTEVEVNVCRNIIRAAAAAMQQHGARLEG